MPRTEKQNERIKQSRKKDLLASALKAFTELEYNNVSVDCVTETVGCSHGLFYHYFDSVDTIFEELLKNAGNFYFEPFDFKTIGDSKAIDAFKYIANYFGSENVLNEAFLCFAKILLCEKNNKIIEKHFSNKYGFKNIQELLLSLVKKGQKEKTIINGDPEMIADVILDYLLHYVITLLTSTKKNRKIVKSNILLGFVSSHEIN